MSKYSKCNAAATVFSDGSTQAHFVNVENYVNDTLQDEMIEEQKIITVLLI